MESTRKSLNTLEISEFKWTMLFPNKSNSQGRKDMRWIFHFSGILNKRFRSNYVVFPLEIFCVYYKNQKNISLSFTLWAQKPILQPKSSPSAHTKSLLLLKKVLIVTYLFEKSTPYLIQARPNRPNLKSSSVSRVELSPLERVVNKA